jgi:hypothetical protein
MTDPNSKNELDATAVCKACGLCCTGHLFTWARLDPGEIITTQALGMSLVQPRPDENGFSLPCPLYTNQCPIYTHPHKPKVCGKYECKMLKEIKNGQKNLAQAMTEIKQFKDIVHELEALLPTKPNVNYNQYLCEHIWQLENDPTLYNTEAAFRLKAGVFFILLEQRFGVARNHPEE